MSTATSSLAPSFLSEGMIIGPNGQRGYGKAVRFTLSNTGGSIIVVRKMYIKILQATPLQEYTFPRGPLAPLTEYSFDVQFKANSQIVPITEKAYAYKRGDIDAFAVHITSEDKYLYKFKIVAEGYDVDHPNENYVRESGVYQIAFPEMITYMTLVNSAKQSVDIFLEGGAAHELILNCYQKLLSKKIRFRCILDRDYYYRSGKFDKLLEPGFRTKYLNSSRFILESGYRHFSNVSSHLMNKSYIILDDKTVLTNDTEYLLGNASYISDISRVKEYRDHFNSLWRKDPYIQEKTYESVFAPVIDLGTAFDIKNVFSQPKITVKEKAGRFDEYMYLLRFNHTDQSISTLIQALSNQDEIVRYEAKASLTTIKNNLENRATLDESSKHLLELISEILKK